MNIDMNLVYNIAAIAALMVCNTILRLALAVKIGDFDFGELRRGVVKYLLTLVAVAFFYVAGELCPAASITLNGETLTIDAALNMLALGLIAAYVVKCFDNLKDIFSDTDLVLAKMQAKNRGY